MPYPDVLLKVTCVTHAEQAKQPFENIVGGLVAGIMHMHAWTTDSEIESGK